VRHPKDKPHVERTIRYVRERLWKGGHFHELADARRQAQAWCMEVAGRRIHGSTGHVPLIVFEERERAHPLPIGGEPYDVPVWRTVTVHPDHHISFQNALYSAPSSTFDQLTQRLARRLSRGIDTAQSLSAQPNRGPAPASGSRAATERYLPISGHGDYRALGDV
jgi:hypothetical protein